MRLMKEKRHVEVLGQVQDHVAGRPGAAGLDEAQVPGGDARGDSQVELAEVAALPPLAEQVPGLVFRLGGPVDANHNQARFSWHLGPADGGEPLVIGFDVAVLDAGGQIASVHGFLDKVPAAA